HEQPAGARSLSRHRPLGPLREEPSFQRQGAPLMISYRLARLAVPAALVFSLAACEDPAKDKPKATVSSASPNTTAAFAPTGPAETFALDAASSSVVFTGSKVRGSHNGRFEKVAGSITRVGGKVEGGKITVSADVDSVTTDAEKLTGHLKSGDFFDAAKFPKA